LRLTWLTWLAGTLQLDRTDGDCAAIFVGGASYPYSAATEMPTPEFARGLRALADEYGAMLVLDEIRTNFRVGPSVKGHWASLGEAPDGLDVAPDMSCLCKAVANGHPLSALVGGERARDGASIITASGTFWLTGGPMAAALATLDVLEADGSAAMSHMQAMGRMLTDGIEEQAARHGVAVTVSGPDAMPFVTFDADDATPAERPRGHVWCAAVAEGGSWVHPHHNWYLSLSHTQSDIAQTLEATEVAFVALKAEYGTE
jgi:glutamate-1-semialdehyde 2,1-aminomutase